MKEMNNNTKSNKRNNSMPHVPGASENMVLDKHHLRVLPELGTKNKPNVIY